MIRVEIELSVPGQALIDVVEAVSHAIINDERLNDAVVHRFVVEKEMLDAMSVCGPSLAIS